MAVPSMLQRRGW